MKAELGRRTVTSHPCIPTSQHFCFLLNALETAAPPHFANRPSTPQDSLNRTPSRGCSPDRGAPPTRPDSSPAGIFSLLHALPPRDPEPMPSPHTPPRLQEPYLPASETSTANSKLGPQDHLLLWSSKPPPPLAHLLTRPWPRPPSGPAQPSKPHPFRSGPQPGWPRLRLSETPPRSTSTTTRSRDTARPRFSRPRPAH